MLSLFYNLLKGRYVCISYFKNDELESAILGN